MSGEPQFYRDLLTEHYGAVDQVIRYVVRRHHLRRDDAEEFASMVWLKLVEDDYAVLRKYQGRSSLRTYLTTVVARLLLDWRTASWGRWRASSRARRLGRTAVLFERLTRRDGLTFAEACEVLRTNYFVPETVADLDALDGLLPKRSKRRMVGEDALARVAAPEPVEGREAATALIAASVQALPAGDHEVIDLVYRENLSIRAVADALRIDPKVLYRRLDRMRRRLKATLIGQQVA